MKIWSPEKIRSLRLKFKLSQVKMSELLGVTQNYIHLLEKGVKKPSKTLQLLMDCVEKKLISKTLKGE